VKVYERDRIAAPGSFIWAAVLANFEPGNHDGYVNYKNDDRVPLLIAGREDHLQAASVSESNFNHYRNCSVVTDYLEFSGRSHYTVGGWLRGGIRERARVGRVECDLTNDFG